MSMTVNIKSNYVFNNSNLNKETIHIEKLTYDELISIYTTHSVRHFPKEELKPVSAIQRMSLEGIYTGYGLYDNEGELLCYAFLTVLSENGNVLLDYFAVMEEYRSHGIGSLFLNNMKNSILTFDGILIEVEDPDYASDQQELLVRNKRIAFYEGNGAFFTGVLAEIFGVRYRLLYFPMRNTPALQTLFDDFSDIYRHMVSDAHYKRHVHIKMPER